MNYQPSQQPAFTPLKPCEPFDEQTLPKRKAIEKRYYKGDGITEYHDLRTTEHAIEIPKGKSVI